MMLIKNKNVVRTLQFYQLAEGATQATQLIVGWFPNPLHDLNYILDNSWLVPWSFT